MSSNVDFRNLKPFRDYRMGRMLRARLNFVRVVLAIGFALYGQVFWFLQIVHGDYYAQQAEENRLHRRLERPPRGMLIDDVDEVLVGNRPSFSVYIDRDRSPAVRQEVEALARILGESPEPWFEQLDKAKNHPRFLPVLLRPDVDLAVASRIEAHRAELPSIDVVMEAKRHYPLGPAGAHVIGYLSEATESELKGRPELIPGDRVGRAGVERAYDGDLRGQPGVLLEEVNALGRSFGKIATQRDPRPGRALRVTLDAAMQRDLYQSFAGRPGGAIFIDPFTGGVRALYSGPSFDPGVFAGRVRAADWITLVGNPQKPLQNRAISSAYSPGSTFKVLMAVAALEEGVVHEHDTIFCAGGKNFYGRVYKCHRAGGHGAVNVVEAVIRSCNVFFYTVGQSLGIDRIAKWGSRFGFGERSGIKLDGESAGLMPSSEWKLKTRGQPWFAGETISVAIGQGQMQATPLQMSVVAAAIANGGYRVRPHFVDRPGDAPEPESLGISPRTLALVREAMTGVVETDRGTARRARVPGVQVAGKTGTAQVVSRDTGAKNPGDNAWFMGFGPVNDPRLSWGIIVEHAGHGGEAAAPIAGIVLRRYLERAQLIEKSNVPEPSLGIDAPSALEPDEPPAPQVARAEIPR